MKGELTKKARENLSAAQLLFDNDMYNASVNRAYYAAFQSAIVALIDRGLVREVYDHKWVHSTFASDLITRRKLFPSRLRSYLLDMLTVRNTADYDGTQIGKKRAYRQLSKADEFVNVVLK